MNPFGEALLNLLQSCGWSNSLEDLATTLGAADDNDPGLVRNVNLLMCRLLEIFAFAGDYKLEDFAHRHELKFVMNYGSGGCVHLLSSSVKHRCIQVSLQVSHNSCGALTAQELNHKLLALIQCRLPEESCKRCDIRVRRTGSFSIQQGCDPDHLTIVCSSPLSFSADDFIIKFSNSSYRIVTVLNWDKVGKRAWVSRERPDGWWSHGVDEGQVKSYKYTVAQVKSRRHLQDVSVLMGIRIGTVGDQQDQDIEGGEDVQDDAHQQASDELIEQLLCSEEDFQPPLISTQLGGQGLTVGEVRERDNSAASTGERTGLSPSQLQDLAREDGNVTTIAAEKDSPTSQSDNRADAACKVCGFHGIVADHLRLSKECVNNLRKEPQLKMKASEPVFIVKASLMLTAAHSMQCPAKDCPGGPHGTLPATCLLWWRESGWTLMGWSGAGTNATSKIVHQKISQFRKNMRKRNKGPSDLTSSLQGEGRVDRQTNDDCRRSLCDFCPNQSSLANHLLNEETCLIAYLRRDLPHRAHKYNGRPKLAVFDLGIMRKFCPNPNCEGDLEGEGVNCHVGGACLQFYRTMGQQLFSWGDNLLASSIESKMKNRRITLMKQLKDEVDIKAYHDELDQQLKFSCSYCSIQGPLLNSQRHIVLGAGSSSSGSQPLWQCVQCSSNEEVHHELVRQIEDKVKALGSPGEHDDTLKKVVVEVGEQGSRVVFVPATLVPEYEGPELGDNLNPMTTTILVPKNPEALEQIGDEALERANQRKRSLEETAEHFGRRHFFGPLTETLSVLYQYKLGNIRIERLAMLSNMKKFRKGKIMSREPNQAEIAPRSAHYAETLKHCLTNTCSFSPAASEKRSRESSARAAVNGQVKLKIEIKLLENLARNSPLLRNIILSCPGDAPLISHAPTVLNYLRAKMSLLMKHIIAPIYSNWDLDLRFADDEWTVTLVGFLYCHEFDGLNRKIARGELTSREIGREIVQHHQVLPSTALAAKRLEEEQGLSEQRAKVNCINLHRQ